MPYYKNQNKVLITRSTNKEKTIICTNGITTPFVTVGVTELLYNGIIETIYWRTERETTSNRRETYSYFPSRNSYRTTRNSEGVAGDVVKIDFVPPEKLLNGITFSEWRYTNDSVLVNMLNSGRVVTNGG